LSLLSRINYKNGSNKNLYDWNETALSLFPYYNLTSLICPSFHCEVWRFRIHKNLFDADESGFLKLSNCEQLSSSRERPEYSSFELGGSLGAVGHVFSCCIDTVFLSKKRLYLA